MNIKDLSPEEAARYMEVLIRMRQSKLEWSLAMFNDDVVYGRGVDNFHIATVKVRAFINDGGKWQLSTKEPRWLETRDEKGHLMRWFVPFNDLEFDTWIEAALWWETEQA